MTDFYVTVLSNSDSSDKIGDFKARLPHALNFNGPFEVALTHLIFPYTFDNVTNISNGDSDFKDNQFLVHFDDTKEQTLSISPNNYQEAMELILNLNYEIDKFLTIQQNRSLPQAVNFFDFNPITKRCVFNTSQLIRGITLSNKLCYLLGFGSRELFKNIEASYPFHSESEFMYIYCNIVDFQIVSNVFAQLLRIVSLKGKYGEMVEISYNRPQYLPVLGNGFDNINVQVKNDHNRIIDFHSGKIALVLHFRPKRKVSDF